MGFGILFIIFMQTFCHRKLMCIRMAVMKYSLFLPHSAPLLNFLFNAIPKAGWDATKYSRYKKKTRENETEKERIT